MEQMMVCNSPIIYIHVNYMCVEKIRKYFEAFGAVQDAVVMKDPVSRRSRGFGFITFEHSSYVDNVLAQDVHTIDSRKVEAKRAVPRSEVSRDPLPAKPAVSSPVVSNLHSPPTSHAVTGNGDDYAFCKIFVGGLHYDTRDGMTCQDVHCPPPLQRHC